MARLKSFGIFVLSVVGSFCLFAGVFNAVMVRGTHPGPPLLWSSAVLGLICGAAIWCLCTKPVKPVKPKDVPFRRRAAVFAGWVIAETLAYLGVIYLARPDSKVISGPADLVLLMGIFCVFTGAGYAVYGQRQGAALGEQTMLRQKALAERLVRAIQALIAVDRPVGLTPELVIQLSSVPRQIAGNMSDGWSVYQHHQAYAALQAHLKWLEALDTLPGVDFIAAYYLIEYAARSLNTRGDLNESLIQDLIANVEREAATIKAAQLQESVAS